MKTEWSLPSMTHVALRLPQFFFFFCVWGGGTPCAIFWAEGGGLSPVWVVALEKNLVENHGSISNDLIIFYFSFFLGGGYPPLWFFWGVGGWRGVYWLEYPLFLGNSMRYKSVQKWFQTQWFQLCGFIWPTLLCITRFNISWQDWNIMSRFALGLRCVSFGIIIL